MDKCSEPLLENILHAYELGILSDPDREIIELHMMKCEHCFNKSLKFKKTARLLREDEDIKGEIKRIDSEKPHKTSTLASLIYWLWPEKPKSVLLKPAIIIGLILIISYPAYKTFLEKDVTIQPVQILNLYPFRGGQQNVISLDKNGQIVINFVCESAEPGKFYGVTVKTEEGAITFADDRFTGFNASGMGSVRIPSNDFRKGRYSLAVTDMSDEKPVVLQEYYFRVE